MRDGQPAVRTPRRPPLLALLFLVLALPTVLIQVYLTPPIQVADEENHFLRALQIAEGHLFGAIEAGNAGGPLDPGAPVFAHAFDALKFHPDTKLDLKTYADAAAQEWGSGPAAPAAFPNTAIYPFYLYVPASLGLAVGRASHLSILDSFYLGRLATALTSVGLAALSLAVCGRGRTLLFVILCLPMTLSLFASVSQDAMAIALGALAVSLWSGCVSRDVAMPAPIRAVVALALGAITGARIPVLPLYALALMPTRKPGPGRPRMRLADCVAAAAGLLPLAVGFYSARVAKVPFREGDGVSPMGQLHWLGLHPVEALQVAVATLEEGTDRYLREFVGVLGWLDTDLPQAFYVWMGLCVLAAVAIDALSSDRGTLPGRWLAVPLLAAVISSADVFAAFDLVWTPVGAPIIEGVQGRYFLVPAMLFATALPAVRRAASGRPLDLESVRLALCATVALVDLWVVPITLLHRYYG